MKIDQLLLDYTNAFKAVSDTAHLDAECLLMHIMDLTRAMLFTHAAQQLTAQQEKDFKQLAKRRLQGEPIAYLTGHKEFWTLDLTVTPDVLIPRPETECLIEWILEQYSADTHLKVADLGVGSGAIALALASERAHWIIHATDNSHKALTIAKENAEKHAIHNVHFFHGEWCSALPANNYDIIISNPPYVAHNDPHLKPLKFEPISALDGGENGLDAIKIIIHQAKDYLNSAGPLIIEHGYDQRDAILSFLQKAGYKNIADHNDLANLPRYCTAKKG